MVFVSYWFSDRFAIRASHAQPISEADDPRLYAIVADLAQRAKVPMPRVYLIPSEQPNAFATGRNPKHSAVAVTVGPAQVPARGSDPRRAGARVRPHQEP